LPGHALLHEAAAEVCVDQASFCAAYGFTQTGIVDALVARKSNQTLRFEDLHAFHPHYEL
jgi:hypothetical protein